MAKSKNLMPIISIVAGVIVLAMPDIIRWVVGLYLLIWGILELKK